jgi:hypothetical protein
MDGYFLLSREQGISASRLAQVTEIRLVDDEFMVRFNDGTYEIGLLILAALW